MTNLYSDRMTPLDNNMPQYQPKTNMFAAFADDD